MTHEISSNLGIFVIIARKREFDEDIYVYHIIRTSMTHEISSNLRIFVIIASIVLRKKGDEI